MKVLGEEEATEVKKGLVKQDYLIAGASACYKIVTWEENVGLLVVGESYKLSALVVRTFNGKKYLSVLTEGFLATKINDIGVVEEVAEEQATVKKITGVFIVGVQSFETFDGCYSCSGKLCLNRRHHQLDNAVDVRLCNASTDARSPQLLDWIWTLDNSCCFHRHSQESLSQ